MIKVIIDRVIAQGLERHYDLCLKESASLLQEAQGFLGSEALKDIHNPNHRITVSLWNNPRSWEQWIRSENRRQLNSCIAPLLDHEEQVTILSR